MRLPPTWPVEYAGDISEDGLFNVLNEDPLELEGIRVDINPITRGKSGDAGAVHGA